MKTRKFLTLLLGVNLAAAISTGWPLASRVLVACNALALLYWVARKAITKED